MTDCCSVWSKKVLQMNLILYICVRCTKPANIHIIGLHLVVHHWIIPLTGWTCCDENQWQLGSAIMVTSVDPKVRYELIIIKCNSLEAKDWDLCIKWESYKELGARIFGSIITKFCIFLLLRVFKVNVKIMNLRNMSNPLIIVWYWRAAVGGNR